LSSKIISNCPKYIRSIQDNYATAAYQVSPAPELKVIPFTATNYTISANVLNQFRGKTLHAIDSIFSINLTTFPPKYKYKPSQLSYYAYKDGFALMTKMEKINTIGQPLDEPDRFEINTKNKISSMKDFFKALFMGNKGYYRFMLFVVAPEPIEMDKSEHKLSFDKANYLLKGGVEELPDYIANKKINNSLNGKVFIYIFEKTETAETPEFVTFPNINGEKHLKATNLFNFISR
jgi:hypothetical protein